MMAPAQPAPQDSCSHGVLEPDIVKEIRSRLSAHMPALDALRGLAVTYVVWHNLVGNMPHAQQVAVSSRLYVLLAGGGWTGVQLFFALSGFLITGILIDSRSRPNRIRNFYARRVLRIFPLYYAVLLVLFVVMPQVWRIPGFVEQDVPRQWWHWTYSTNWSWNFALGHFWSLAVEEQFYLIWPLLVYALSTRGILLLSAGLLASAPLVRLALLLPPHAGLPADLAVHGAYTFTVARWDALAAGALAAVLVRDARWLTRWLPGLPVRAAVLGTGLIALGVWRRGFDTADVTIAVVGESLAAIFFAQIVLLGATRPRGTADKPAPWPERAAAFIGKYSYAIYIVHIPIMGLCGRRLAALGQGQGLEYILGMTGVFLVVFIASVATAFISWHLLEHPFLRLKRYF